MEAPTSGLGAGRNKAGTPVPTEATACAPDLETIRLPWQSLWTIDPDIFPELRQPVAAEMGQDHWWSDSDNYRPQPWRQVIPARDPIHNRLTYGTAASGLAGWLCRGSMPPPPDEMGNPGLLVTAAM